MISPEIKKLIKRGNITLEEIKSLRCHLWEWEAMVPILDDEVFVFAFRHIMDNVQFDGSRPCRSYNEAMALLYVPELLKRFISANKIIDSFQIDRVSNIKKFEREKFIQKLRFELNMDLNMDSCENDEMNKILDRFEKEE